MTQKEILSVLKTGDVGAITGHSLPFITELFATLQRSLSVISKKSIESKRMAARKALLEALVQLDADLSELNVEKAVASIKLEQEEVHRVAEAKEFAKMEKIRQAEVAKEQKIRDRAARIAAVALQKQATYEEKILAQKQKSMARKQASKRRNLEVQRQKRRYTKRNNPNSQEASHELPVAVGLMAA